MEDAFSNIQPWLDFYKPRTLEDIVGNDLSVSCVRELVSSSFLHNTLLHGPPGCGKTSTLHCISSSFDSSLDISTLEINASDKRRLVDIRSLVRPFILQSSAINEFKLVILDESDNMTVTAQRALASLIRQASQYYPKCFFILACNDISKIDSSLLNILLCLKFDSIDNQSMRLGMEKLLHSKNIAVLRTDDQTFWQTVYTKADGDMRVAINLLQACAESTPSGSEEDGPKMLTLSSLQKVCDSPSSDACSKMALFMTETGSKSINASEAIGTLRKLHQKGHSVTEILKGIKNVLYSQLSLSNHIKFATTFTMIAEMELKASLGCSTMLQLEALILKVAASNNTVQ